MDIGFFNHKLNKWNHNLYERYEKLKKMIQEILIGKNVNVKSYTVKRKNLILLQDYRANKINPNKEGKIIPFLGTVESYNSVIQINQS